MDEDVLPLCILKTFKKDLLEALNPDYPLSPRECEDEEEVQEICKKYTKEMNRSISRRLMTSTLPPSVPCPVCFHGVCSTDRDRWTNGLVCGVFLCLQSPQQRSPLPEFFSPRRWLGPLTMALHILDPGAWGMDARAWHWISETPKRLSANPKEASDRPTRLLCGRSPDFWRCERRSPEDRVSKQTDTERPEATRGRHGRLLWVFSRLR